MDWAWTSPTAAGKAEDTVIEERFAVNRSNNIHQGDFRVWFAEFKTTVEAFVREQDLMPSERLQSLAEEMMRDMQRLGNLLQGNWMSVSLCGQEENSLKSVLA